MSSLPHISSNIKRIQEDIARAAQRSGRNGTDVTLVAVTKTYPVEYVTAAIKAGITDAGENRIQEALLKIEALKNVSGPDQRLLRWHLIGHLQSNKAKPAVQNFDLIHSVDSVRLAREISRHSAADGKLTSILIQVNVSGEESKSGLPLEAAESAVADVLESAPDVVIKGLMTMAPFEVPEAARPHFKALRELRDRITRNISHSRLALEELSMGMSNDYLVAVEEGSTMVRVGSAIFGPRRG